MTQGFFLDMAANKWDVKVDGRDHTISVERGQTGKDVIRVDGRAAGRPLGADENSRDIIVAGSLYVVRRAGKDGFEVAPGAVMPVTTTTSADTSSDRLRGFLEKAAQPPGKPKDPGPPPGYREGTRNKVILAVFVAIVLLVGFSFKKSMFPDAAEKRVSVMLHDMKGGQRLESEISRYMWARGSPLDSQELGWADTQFNQWRMAKNFNEGFSTYKVLGSEKVEGAAPPAKIVTFVVDGRELKVIVPERLPMKWAD